MLSDSEIKDLRLAREERLARERQIVGEKRPVNETFTHPQQFSQINPAAKKTRRQEKVSKEIAPEDLETEEAEEGEEGEEGETIQGLEQPPLINILNGVSCSVKLLARQTNNLQNLVDNNSESYQRNPKLAALLTWLNKADEMKALCADAIAELSSEEVAGLHRPDKISPSEVIEANSDQPWNGLIAQDHLLSLPNEIWEEICKQLKPLDLMALKRTNKLANRFVSQVYSKQKLKYLHCYQDGYRTINSKPKLKLGVTLFLGSQVKKLKTDYAVLYICALKNFLGEEFFKIEDFKGLDKNVLQQSWPLDSTIIDIAEIHDVIEREDVPLLRMLIRQNPHFAVKVFMVLIGLTAGVTAAMNSEQKRFANLFTALIPALTDEALLHQLFFGAINLKHKESEFILRYFIDNFPHFLRICEGARSKRYPIIALLSKHSAGRSIRESVGRYMIQKSSPELRKAYLDFILRGDFPYDTFRRIIVEGLSFEELLSMAEDKKSHHYPNYALLHREILEKATLIEYIKCNPVLQRHPRLPLVYSTGQAGDMLKDLAPGWTIEKLEDLSSLREHGHELLLAASKNPSLKTKIENHLKSKLHSPEVYARAESLDDQGKLETTSHAAEPGVSTSGTPMSGVSMQANASAFFRAPNTDNSQNQQEEDNKPCSEKSNSPRPN